MKMAAFKLNILYPCDENQGFAQSAYSRIKLWALANLPVQSASRTWPAVRSGHRCVANESHLFVYGGYDPKKTFGELWSFNLTTKQWEMISSDCPPFSASSAMLLSRGHIYVFGGSGFPFGFSNSDDFRTYSLRANRWIDLMPISSGDKPSPRYGSAMVMDTAGKIYVHSGTEGTAFLNDMYTFDTGTLEWRTVDITCESAPTARYRHEVVFFKDKFYIFGGATLSESFGFELIDIFECKTTKWNKIKTFPCETNGFPKPRKAHSCVLFEDKVFMACGVYHDGNRLQYLNDMWRLDLGTLKWKKLDLMFPYGMHFHGAAVTPAGSMYVFGGVKEAVEDSGLGCKRTADLFQIWLTVPPLLELAWSSVFSMACMANCDPYQTLDFLGVPTFLLDRIQSISPPA